MKCKRDVIRLLILAAFFIASLNTNSRPASAQRDNIWLGRPWNIRYVLFAEPTDDFGSGVRACKTVNANRRPTTVYLCGYEFLEPRPAFPSQSVTEISLAVLRFDHAGNTDTDSRALNGQSAGFTNLGHLAIKNSDPLGLPIYIADWSQGIPGEVEFSPAVCRYPDDARYTKRWIKDDFRGGFGCREWTAQLYDQDQPYIDVTSYIGKRAFIGQFVGWSRFEDPPKPVIGRQGKTWMCLYDCPDGEKPGPIKDIKAWTAQHKFPMPKPPHRQPVYPDADYPNYWEE